MKRLFFLLLIIFSCKDPSPVIKPKNLLSEEKMSELIAEFAINDQMGILNPNGQLEVSARYILKQHKVDAKQFSESYKYYLASPQDLEKIFTNAQEVLKRKDPKAKDYINKKLKGEHTDAPIIEK